jgi:hypothetical protein
MELDLINPLRVMITMKNAPDIAIGSMGIEVTTEHSGLRGALNVR